MLESATHRTRSSRNKQFSQHRCLAVQEARERLIVDDKHCTKGCARREECVLGVSEFALQFDRPYSGFELRLDTAGLLAGDGTAPGGFGCRFT